MDHVTWIYYLDNDGSVVPLPNVRFRRFLYEGAPEFPHYANQVARLAVVFLRLIHGLPRHISRIEYNQYPVDPKGSLSADYWARVSKDTVEYLMAYHEKERRQEPNNVVGYERLKEKAYLRSYSWEPDAAFKDRLIALVEARAELPPGSLHWE